MKAPLALMHGAEAGSGALGVADGLPATDCKVVHNTWVRCAQLRLGHSSAKRPLRPMDCTFAYNIVSETDDDRLLRLFEADGITCRGNILHATRGKETGIEGMEFSEDAFRVVDPQLEKRGGVYRLGHASAAMNAAAKEHDFVKKDMDGDLRDDRPDIGADEHVAQPQAERKPLNAAGVGP